MHKIRKIRTVLFTAFAIPLILIITLGVVAYHITSNAMVAKYREAANGTVATMTLYMDSVCNNVKTRMAELIINDDMNAYYNNNGQEVSIESKEHYDAIRDNFIALKTSQAYVSDYIVFGKLGEAITSHDKTLSKGLYDDFMQQKEAEIFKEGQNRNAWIGRHSYLDEVVQGSDKNYAFSYIVKMQKNNGFIVIDINKEYMEDVLSTMKFGKGSIKAMVTSDGREIAILEGDASKYTQVSNSGANIFEKYKATINLEHAGSAMVNYQGREYLLAYSPIASTGIVLYSLIPQSVIMKDVNQVKNLTIFIIIIAVIIVGIIGTKLSDGISKELRKICSLLESVSAGNLNVTFQTRRKDEFKLLNISINEMLKNIRKLIGGMKEFTNQVSDSAEGVSQITVQVHESMSNVSNSVNNILEGVIMQAGDTEQCAGNMNSLSDKLNGIYQSAGQMNITADKTLQTINTGQEMVDELNHKTKDTMSETQHLIEEIMQVQKKTDNIREIVKYINDIAGNTNLLSLNASIEAARAGESGRGFAVVAEEIRKLSDQSRMLNNEINSIIEDIQAMTKKTVASAEKTGGYMLMQMSSLENANEIFNSIDNQVVSLVGDLKTMQGKMDEMIRDKEQILNDICSVSSVSEESAAVSQESGELIRNQLTSISTLSKEADRLIREVNKLEESMSQFVV